ncbi:GlxA family transcriptional regulator [Desulfosarcina ovata]|uniref:AraC family transcriptional regulator n=1 Tax=Desulfosarcina ovata subsp. ovata TaxID=2752305 RepID=A0A5K8A802_9BACT|nr:helix-turn-helix domain-containing protein [Desulfosarcina ovata]BBO88665.1 AraC family transcriptional regulator [Desulfosarcina ovata subsp. ovata]
MINVTVLAMQHTSASAIIGPMDVFSQAGVMWNRFKGQRVTPHFKVRVVTPDGEAFKCSNGVRMAADGSIRDVAATDLIVVSSIANVEKNRCRQGGVVEWLSDHYQRGSHIASICTGSFLLAETGLLDGKRATTHWAFAEEFRRRYPKVAVRTDRPIVDENDLYSSGGYNASIDMSLYLVEKYCGHEVALQSAKVIAASRGESSGPPYTAVQCRRDHHDDQIISLQQYIEENFNHNFNYDDLAEQSHMSRRTLERRFKAATGKTPLSYQQCMRIKAAKQLLADGGRSFEEITCQVGYEDSSSFRKIFTKYTHVSPAEYRKRFPRV